MNPFTSPLAGYNRSHEVNAQKLMIIAVFTGSLISGHRFGLPVKTLIVYRFGRKVAHDELRKYLRDKGFKVMGE
jgi:hypothetical protein